MSRSILCPASATAARSSRIAGQRSAAGRVVLIVLGVLLLVIGALAAIGGGALMASVSWRHPLA